MLFNLKKDCDKERYKEYVNKLFTKETLVEVTEKKGRSLPQNSYLHVIIAFFASQYGIGVDEAKVDFYKRASNKELYVVPRENGKGNRLRSSRELTKEEMTLSIERFRDWSVMNAGIYLPSAHEEEFLFYARQEIERNKEYL